MNKLRLIQIDAFASKQFEGNPAAVCPLTSWLPDATMQAIAAENNLSETAFFVEKEGIYQIRWFSPTVEVKLCGHATIASAYVLFEMLGFADETILFNSKSGELRVSKAQDKYVLDFPLQQPTPCTIPEPIKQAFGSVIKACLKAEDYIVVLQSESNVVDALPDLNLLKKFDLRGVCITAKSEQYDFVSRFFAPKYGIDEDPVTGSSFTQLTPYWSEVLGKNKLAAKQVSQRGGEVWCELRDDRVLIAGYASLYLKGYVYINHQ